VDRLLDRVLLFALHGPKARAFGRVVWDSYSERVIQKAAIFSWLIQDSGENVARNKG
jgi:hypothetical protein